MDKLRDLANNLKQLPSILGNLEGMLDELKDVAKRDLTAEQATKLQNDIKEFELPDKIKEMNKGVMSIKKKAEGFR